MEHTNGLTRRLGCLLRSVDPTPDAELLTRFIDDRDPDAFARLVRRHGPMVHGVCRRVLQNQADADDAFQATFLVLARRAQSVRPRSLLGNWLYGVAYRTALEARRADAVRRLRERSSAAMRRTPDNNGPSPDLREILDREIAALPDTYRAAIILCDLEGLSRKDAANRLGWREGTLSGRLARARSLLAARLSRRGLVVPLTSLGTMAATASAHVPAELLESTARIGILLAAGEAAVVASAPVAALSEGVMKAMLLTKLKAMATAIMVGGAILATTIAGWQANATGAGEPQTRERPGPAGSSRTASRDSDKDRIAELERERDLLLRHVRELRDRLAKLEAAQEDRNPNRERVELERSALELLKRRQMELDRAKGPASGWPKVEARDPLSIPRRAEEGLSKLAEKEMKLKQKQVEEDRARAFERTTRPALSEDRVAELEERLTVLERNLRGLLADVEKLRRK